MLTLDCSREFPIRIAAFMFSFSHWENVWFFTEHERKHEHRTVWTLNSEHTKNWHLNSFHIRSFSVYSRHSNFFFFFFARKTDKGVVLHHKLNNRLTCGSDFNMQYAFTTQSTKSKSTNRLRILSNICHEIYALSRECFEIVISSFCCCCCCTQMSTAHTHTHTLSTFVG